MLTTVLACPIFPYTYLNKLLLRVRNQNIVKYAVIYDQLFVNVLILK